MKKILEFDKKIVDIMIGENNDEYMVRKIAEFMQSKGEKITYNENEDRYYINSFFPSFPGKAWDRLMSDIYKIANEGYRVPMKCDIVVTGKCHCRCWHCFRIKDKREDLSFEKIKESIHELYDMGTVNIGITGGEPMIRPDILDILREIPDGMEGELFTTGHSITPEVAKEIKKTNVSRCIISIDHYVPKRANEMRHYNNAFNEAIQAVKNLVANEIYTAVTVCIVEDLMEEEIFTNYLNFIVDLGPDEIRVVLPIPQGNLETVEVGSIYPAAVKHVKDFRNSLKDRIDVPTVLNFCELENQAYLGCGAGANYISLNNDGMVTPCVAAGYGFGNVQDKSIKVIFEEMGEFFPRAAQICYGITTSRVKKQENIFLEQTPYPVAISREIAKKVKRIPKKAAFYEFIKNQT